MGTSGPERYTTRYTLKRLCASGEDSTAHCIKSLKSFFKKVTKSGDKKVFLAPWCNNEEEVPDRMSLASQIATDPSELSSHILSFFIRRGERRRTDYMQIYLGRTEQIKEMKDEKIA